MRDPEAAAEKLEEIEKARVLERATLRHNAGGATKFAKILRTAAKRDPKIRAHMNEQLKQHRQLTEKLHGDESDRFGTSIIRFIQFLLILAVQRGMSWMRRKRRKAERNN